MWYQPLSPIHYICFSISAKIQIFSNHPELNETPIDCVPAQMFCVKRERGHIPFTDRSTETTRVLAPGYRSRDWPRSRLLAIHLRVLPCDSPPGFTVIHGAKKIHLRSE